MNYKTDWVLILLDIENVDRDICSPNYVADFARSRDLKLSSEEIVYISNNYGEV